MFIFPQNTMGEIAKSVKYMYNKTTGQKPWN